MTLKKDFIDQLKQNKVLLGAALTWYSVKGSDHASLSLWLIRKPFFCSSPKQPLWRFRSRCWRVWKTTEGGYIAGELATDHVMRRENMFSAHWATKPRNLQRSIADLETSPNTCHQDCRPAPHRGLQSSRRREQETQSELSQTAELPALSRTAPTQTCTSAPAFLCTWKRNKSCVWYRLSPSGGSLREWPDVVVRRKPAGSVSADPGIMLMPWMSRGGNCLRHDGPRKSLSSHWQSQKDKSLYSTVQKTCLDKPQS